MTALRLALAFSAALPAAAAAQETGSGELWLHEDVWAYYEEFRDNDSGHYFAVSTNGLDAGYSYCPSFNDCLPLDGKREALRACNSSPSGLPGQCYIFASHSGIVWRGTVHVLTDAEFIAHHFGPETVAEALADYVRQVVGPGGDHALPFAPTAAVWRRPDFDFPPAGFALAGEECAYAFEAIYQAAATRNFFLADASGRYCGFATGFAQAAEQEAFQAALEACRALAGTADCLVHAAADRLLAGLGGL